MESEIEIMESAYGHSFKLIALDANIAKFDITLDLFSTVIRFSIPSCYPDVHMKFSILQSEINNSEKDLVNKLLTEAFVEKVAGSMEICQQLEEYLQDIESEKVHSVTAGNDEIKMQIVEVKLARFLIYFHHIFWYANNVNLMFRLISYYTIV